MEKNFSPIECQWIWDKLSTIHNERYMSMYQNINHKSILVVKLPDTCTNDLNKLSEMDIHVTIFGSMMSVELWMGKI